MNIFRRFLLRFRKRHPIDTEVERRLRERVLEVKKLKLLKKEEKRKKKEKKIKPLTPKKPTKKQKGVNKKKCIVTQKTIYLKRSTSVLVAERMRKKTVNNYMRSYRCEFCNYWHLTHKKRL